jgi:dUTP pyrophosphatase
LNRIIEKKKATENEQTIKPMALTAIEPEQCNKTLNKNNMKTFLHNLTRTIERNKKFSFIKGIRNQNQNRIMKRYNTDKSQEQNPPTAQRKIRPRTTYQRKQTQDTTETQKQEETPKPQEEIINTTTSLNTQESIITIEKVNIKEGIEINLTKNFPKDTGYDLQANIDNPLLLGPNQRAIISTGIKMEIPEHLDVQIRPRSGLALTKGLTVLNTPGTIDSGYQGEIKVILINLGHNEIIVEPGMRIAQMTFSYKASVLIKEGKISPSKDTRANSGLGSSDLGK